MPTVTELRKELERIEALGFGGSDVQVMQYAGGDDAPCDVKPVVPEQPGMPVMLETTFVRW